MCKIISFVIIAIAGWSTVQAGLVGSSLGYSAGFQSSLTYAAPHFASSYAAPAHFESSYAASPHFASSYAAPHFGNSYAAPLPVAPISGHPYAVGYSATPPIIKYHSGISPFSVPTTYSHIPTPAKFAHPAAVASFYSSPLPYAAHPGLAYNSYSSPNTVVKYGPPITTTTTTYSTTAAVAPAPISSTYANPLNAVAGW